MSTTGPPSVPAKTSVAPGVPELKMTTPIAPAASAFAAFCPKAHVPPLDQGDGAGGEVGEVLSLAA
jgi:hypothetical protein